MNPTSARLTDAVCGMGVTDKSQHHIDRDGQTYYFCSAKCSEKFALDPKRYKDPALAAGAIPKMVTSMSGAIYTCPMHPEVRQDHLGSCPKCGMALEPELPTQDNDDNPELRDFSRRFWWTLPLTCIVFVLAMFGHLLHLMDMALQSWVEMVLTCLGFSDQF